MKKVIMILVMLISFGYCGNLTYENLKVKNVRLWVKDDVQSAFVRFYKNGAEFIPQESPADKELRKKWIQINPAQGESVLLYTLSLLRSAQKDGSAVTIVIDDTETLDGGYTKLLMVDIAK